MIPEKNNIKIMISIHERWKMFCSNW